MSIALARLWRADTDIPAPPERGTVALSATGVGYRVDGRWLVADVTVEVVVGQVLAVIGPNGAGKSTLLSLLAGDLAPSTGNVHLGGRALSGMDVTGLARRRAVLPQKQALSFPFTVAEVVEMGRAPWAGTDAEDDDEVAITIALDATDTTVLADRRFPTLSGGEQAGVSFARILAQNCAVLLLDEPTAALDLRHQEQLMVIAAGCAAEGQAVLVVLHDIELAAAYADVVAVLDRGRLVACGPPEVVLTEALLETVYQLPVDVFAHPAGRGLIITPRRTRREKGAVL